MPLHGVGEPPDFVAVGHLTVDELPAGLRPGGSVLYAGLMALRQGLRVGLVTSYGPDFPQDVLPPEIEVVAVPAPVTTRFALDYTPKGRTLTLRARAAALAPMHLPERFAEAGIAYLAPVADEVASDFAAAFPQAAVGVGAQGWCRQWDRDGRVSMRPWPDPAPVLARAQALFLSSDDVAGWEAQALQLYQRVPLGALTLAARGAILFVNGERYPVAPAPAAEVEPTGAGDVFAAAFLIAYNRSGDPFEAAAFAAVAGALTVEADGIAGVPSREQLARRWREFQLR
ncbi:MAG TPA: PfkB family carbohydrate kinase [Methylomirabilota bacterium]|nr:PfkB family carbohydrate kinase [Methylomirabilota bacterium]